MLNSNFTRKNIQNVICNGRNISSFPRQEKPYFIIKVGPPGSGKSSSNNHVIALDVDPASAIFIDIDKVNASFKSFRNQTRNLRRSYNNKPFNKEFFNTLSVIHHKHQSKKSLSNQTIVGHNISYVITEGIKQGAHIIMETTKPINTTLSMYGNMLQRNNYKIAVIYHKSPPINVLVSRILERGEELYRTQQYYRAFPLNTLNTVIDKLKENLTTYILPLVLENKIHHLVITE
jgi:hypothetical protein